MEKKNFDVLLDIAQNLSQGDLSTHAALLGIDGEGQIGTSKNSMHYHYLSKLAEMGYAKEIVENIAGHQLNSFLITNEGKSVLAKVLQEIEAIKKSG